MVFWQFNILHKSGKTSVACVRADTIGEAVLRVGEELGNVDKYNVVDIGVSKLTV